MKCNIDSLLKTALEDRIEPDERLVELTKMNIQRKASNNEKNNINIWMIISGLVTVCEILSLFVIIGKNSTVYIIAYIEATLWTLIFSMLTLYKKGYIEEI